MSLKVKSWIDAAGVDLADEGACLEAIFHASRAVAPGRRAEAMEWGAAYLDLLRNGRSTARPTPPPAQAHRTPCEAVG
ncbi:hypothetical protein [Azospirillum sp. sgz301742]